MKENDFRQKYWKYSLIILIILLGLILFNQSIPYLNGILIAVTLFILLRKPAIRLSERIGASKAALLLTIGVVLFIFIPIGLIVWLIIDQMGNINWNPQVLIEPAERIYQAINSKISLEGDMMKYITAIASKMTSVGQHVVTGISGFVMDILIAIILLFFLISSREKMENYVREILPFNKKNIQDVVGKISLMVRSNAIGIPLLAFIQGLIAWCGYLLFHVPNPLVFALITGIASVIPVVGTALVWVPMSIYLFVIGDWQFGLCLIGFGILIISQSDNLIRFILQKKMADTHPLITMFGVLIGIPIFGFMGLIFGPLLVSLFLLFIDIFKKEYLYVTDNEASETECSPCRMAIFDLDGTLLNSIQDIANAANYALKKHGYAEHSLQEINSYVGNGIGKLIERALPEGHRDEQTVKTVKASFTEYYDIHKTDQTQPYPGIVKMLETLHSRDIKIAVASNKYDAAAKSIVAKCFPGIEFASVYGQMDDVPQKPAPDMVYRICRENGIPIENIIYVGDSDVDMMTGKNAGARTIGVAWGFRTVEQLSEYHPEKIVYTADEILNICNR